MTFNSWWKLARWTEINMSYPTIPERYFWTHCKIYNAFKNIAQCKFSVVKNDAGSFDKAGCWLFLSLTILYFIDSVLNFIIIIISIFSKLQSTSGRGFWIQTGFFLLYFYGHFIASCVILFLGYIFNKISDLTCMKNSLWKKSYDGAHKLLTYTLLGVYKMLPEIKRIDKTDETDSHDESCKVCKLCKASYRISDANSIL